jgi:prevent-host-death family protein
MKTISFTEFRKNASNYFHDVEKGNVLIIVRHGKPIAEISPPSMEINQSLSWKKPGLRIAIKWNSLSDSLLKERATY